MTIRIGPSGFGGKDEAIDNLKVFSERGIDACEIAYTYGVYLKKDDAIEIGKVAKELGIFLSIHAPYYVNLNSLEKEKIEASKKRILDCCESAHYLGAKWVVFHCGFYSKMSSEKAGENIALQIEELMTEIKKKNWDVELCPEVMGKKNVFGSIEEISELVKKTGCGFCVDFAHVLARYGEVRWKELAEAFPQKNWHCHFSGIEYGEKGEKKHLRTDKKEWKKVIDFLKENKKDAVVICESPSPFEDAVIGKELV